MDDFQMMAVVTSIVATVAVLGADERQNRRILQAIDSIRNNVWHGRQRITADHYTDVVFGCP